MSNIKKNIIIACCLFIGGVIIGFGISEYKSRTILGESARSAAVLQERVQQLESELGICVARLESANARLGAAESRIDECLGITEQLGGDLQQCREALGGSNPVIKELRKRIMGYEDRIAELQRTITAMQSSITE